MSHHTESSTLHVALFVDFDNIYITLEEQDRDAAVSFASHPAKWLAWLEAQIPKIDPRFQGCTCRVLVRHCYLNPEVFSRYRSFFIRAGFEIIDCPPLTTKGKTGADIRIAMDILDTLAAPAQYDVFVILSADSDFTPILLRLRKHQRYTAMLAVGMVSPAYKAASDLILSQDELCEDGLGLRPLEETPRPAGIIPQALYRTLRMMAERLAEVARVPGGLVADKLAGLYKEFPEFRQTTTWLGFGSLRGLTEQLVNMRTDLTIVEEDPWRVARPESFGMQPIETAAPTSTTAVITGTDQAAATTAFAEWLITLVSNSPTPVPMAMLAHEATRAFTNLAPNNWLGFATFKSLLSALDLGTLQMTSAGPGFLYDPARHTAPTVDDGSDTPGGAFLLRDDRFTQAYPAIAPLARQIHQITETPYLLPEEYATLLTVIAEEVNANGYQITRTSKNARDRCLELGTAVARKHVTFVLTGIWYVGHRFDATPEHPRDLGQMLIQNVYNLCRSAQFSLTPEDEELITRWILGGFIPAEDTLSLDFDGIADAINLPAVSADTAPAIEPTPLAVEPVAPDIVPMEAMPQPVNAVTPQATPRRDKFSKLHPTLAPLAREIHEVTETPYLLPEDYAVLLTALADEINTNGWLFAATTTNVRERCHTHGIVIARKHIDFVLKGIWQTGYHYTNPPEDPDTLGQRFTQYIRNLYQEKRHPLTVDDEALLTVWILGALPLTTAAAG